MTPAKFTGALLSAAVTAPIVTVTAFSTPALVEGHTSLEGVLLFDLWALMFGAVGSAIFLGIAFFIALKIEASPAAVLTVSVFAAFAHSLIGSLIAATHAFPTAVLFFGGFMLDVFVWSGNVTNSIMLAVAKCIGGFAAGLLFVGIALPRHPPQRPSHL